MSDKESQLIGQHPRVLITGGLGFLGLAVARRFKADGYCVYGIGHGIPSSLTAIIYEKWITADISLESLHKLGVDFDVVVHCAGPNSVGQSFLNPKETFQSSILSTLILLEYLRQAAPNAMLIYASSAAVYGVADDRPLTVRDQPNPVSPYGYYKWMAELLLKSHAESFGIKFIAVRFFSIYGVELKRQLLWEASLKLMSENHASIFWGTGQETRDWIHVDDAVDLIAHLALNAPPSLRLINGGTGIRMTIKQTLHQLRNALGNSSEIIFNGKVRAGDPIYYLADMTDAVNIGWRPKVNFSKAIIDYAQWVKDAK